MAAYDFSFGDRTIGIDGVPVVYLPEQTDLVGSIAIGDGLRNLSHTDSDSGQANVTVGIEAGATSERAALTS